MASFEAGRRTRVIGVVVLALLVVPVALALPFERPTIRYNPADQATAKATVLRLSDFQVVGAGWKGGAKPPQMSEPDRCLAKQADLVVTGAAKSEFVAGVGVISVTTEAFILQTRAMVSADWQRTIANTAYMSCVSKELTTDLGTGKLISFKKIAFPKVAQYTARYRLLADFPDKTGKPVRLMMDVIAVGQGRTELTLLFMAPYSMRGNVELAERDLLQLMLNRIAR